LVRRSHCAVGRFPGSVVFHPAGSAGNRLKLTGSSPLFEFHLPLESYSALPSRSAAADQLLSWAFAPYSTFQARRSTCRGIATPATFRLQGLITLLTVSSLRALAGFVSHRQRSWDSPFEGFPFRKVSAAFPPGCAHLPFPPSGIPAAEAPGRPDRGRFLGFDPPGSPWQSTGRLTRRLLEPSLGFPLPGFSRDSLDRVSTRSPLTRFLAPGAEAPNPPASQSLTRLSPALIPAHRRSSASG